MQTTIHKINRLRLSDNAKSVTIDVISYLFVAMFVYTATDKFWKIQDFQKFMARLDLLHDIGKYVAWIIPGAEVIISMFLLVPKTRKTGLYLSFGIMTLFTSYLIYMKLTAEKLPCHCGGAISQLTWGQHIWLNLVLILLAALSIFFSNSMKTAQHA